MHKATGSQPVASAPAVNGEQHEQATILAAVKENAKAASTAAGEAKNLADRAKILENEKDLEPMESAVGELLEAVKVASEKAESAGVSAKKAEEMAKKIGSKEEANGIVAEAKALAATAANDAKEVERIRQALVNGVAREKEVLAKMVRVQELKDKKKWTVTGMLTRFEDDCSKQALMISLC